MSNELIPVYVVFLADDKGNFDWIYTVPKPYYQTREEAEEVRRELIEKEETVTKENSKVKGLWRIPQ
jgi:hypothetical protein